MGWKREGKPTAKGEQLLDLYLNGAEDREYQEMFGDEVKLESLKRTARELRALVNEEPLTKEQDNNYVNEEIIKPRVMYYDIETTNFKGDFGIMLMMAYQWADEDEVHLISIRDNMKMAKKMHPFEQDYFVVREAVKLFDEADVVVGHYAKRFDFKYIQTRAAAHGLEPVTKPAEVDTWEISRSNFLVKNSLANLAQFLGVDEQKGGLTKKQWYGANHLWDEDLEAMEEYCKQDVRTQKAITERLYPYAKNLPGYQILHEKHSLSCNNLDCGSENVVRNGWKYTNVMKYPRYKCTDCGHQMRGRKSVFDRNTSRLAE